MRLATLLTTLLASLPAAAEPVGEDDAPPPSRDDEPTADDVAGAPRPGEESGRVDAERGTSIARAIGRGALFVPRLVAKAAFAPIRGGLWAYDRYSLKDRYYKIFFNDARTFGVLPSLSIEAGYGGTFGAKVVHTDLLGDSEHLGLAASTGGRYRQLVKASVDTGDRLGRAEIELDARFERRPRDAFYGIGDSGELMPQTRFRQQLARATLASDVRIAGPLHVRGAGAIADFEFGRSEEGVAIDEVYPTETMTGFAGGVRHTYLELELAWDSRRHARRYEVAAVPATGWLVSAFGGRVFALDDNADYWRYGGDLQTFVRVGAGPRVISARLYGEAVSGSLAEVPFTQLPRLGGSTLLRGYSADRFRDRVAAVGSLSYRWDLSRALSATLFVDAGRVFPAVSDIELSGLRVGYGLEFEAHTARSFVARVLIATSIDGGGTFLNLAFDPVFDLKPRTERR